MSRRSCLKCNCYFNSSGAGNRLCPHCNSNNLKIRTIRIVPAPDYFHSMTDPDLPPLMEKNGKEESDPESCP